jgi:hypothetical protein
LFKIHTHPFPLESTSAPTLSLSGIPIGRNGKLYIKFWR